MFESNKLKIKLYDIYYLNLFRDMMEQGIIGRKIILELDSG